MDKISLYMFSFNVVSANNA